MSEEIISFIDFTVMSDEEKYKLLNIRDNRISSLNIVNEELEYKLQQKENIIKEVREYIEKGIYSVDGSYVLKILDKEVN